ncbi:hypothetical protein M409DRAFT_15906 [Zasmidium cellare ATCC 36951]|uniref:Uncharacterized protein n=1 Tax=Zasmidium cellare ATCC 36951 TaxID=1080233 RepID=A0A6A6D5D9_ZASCE|nr:uncharacterized protein M409DRAFT_15906 [Zasmidium cellare ATCC 36951]KAF2173628.1 hypothetical protein M409DRAFT_15906 [Zasmidium cellare ATCC 36951]
MDVIYEYYLVDQTNRVEYRLAPGEGGEEMYARQEELARVYGDLRVAPEAFRHLLVRQALPAYVSLPDLLLGPHSAPLPAPMGNVGNAIAAPIVPVAPVAPVAPMAVAHGPVAAHPAPVVAPRAVAAQENPTPAANAEPRESPCGDGALGKTDGERNDHRVQEGRARRGRPRGSKTKRTEPYPTNGGSGTQNSPVHV